MLKTSLRRFLSLFCCICFMANYVSSMIGNMALAAASCPIEVLGYSSIDESTYNYATTDGTPNGVMYASYKIGDDGQETACVPDRSGNLSLTPGANVTFTLEPKTGFTAGLKINGELVEIQETEETNKFTYTITNIQAAETTAEAVFTTQTNESQNNILVNLKYVEDKQIKNGTYNDNFETKWATVEYSTDSGNTYVPLNQGTTIGEDGSYTFDSSIDSIDVRLTWTGKVMAAVDSKLAESGEKITLTKGSHTIIFQESAYTIIWLYSGEGIDKSAITKNGKIAIKKDDGIDGQEDSTGGIYAVAPGTQVTMRFTPDYGYQFTKNSIDDELEVTPESDECTYTFTMPEDDIIIGDIFTENPDITEISTPSISSANILNAPDMISSGNLSLTVADSLMTQDKKDKIVSFASENDLTPVTYLDMELSQFLTKGATGEKWETMLTETSVPAKFTFTLADDLKGEDSYTVMRIDGNEITCLETTYNASEATLQFETNKISQFVIAKSTPKTAIASVAKVITGDPNKLLLYSILAVAAIAGFVYTFRLSKLSKKNKKFKM